MSKIIPSELATQVNRYLFSRGMNQKDFCQRNKISSVTLRSLLKSLERADYICNLKFETLKKIKDVVAPSEAMLDKINSQHPLLLKIKTWLNVGHITEENLILGLQMFNLSESYAKKFVKDVLGGKETILPEMQSALRKLIEYVGENSVRNKDEIKIVIERKSNEKHQIKIKELHDLLNATKIKFNISDTQLRTALVGKGVSRTALYSAMVYNTTSITREVFKQISDAISLLSPNDFESRVIPRKVFIKYINGVLESHNLTLTSFRKLLIDNGFSPSQPHYIMKSAANIKKETFEKIKQIVNSYTPKNISVAPANNQVRHIFGGLMEKYKINNSHLEQILRQSNQFYGSTLLTWFRNPGITLKYDSIVRIESVVKSYFESINNTDISVSKIDTVDKPNTVKNEMSVEDLNDLALYYSSLAKIKAKGLQPTII